MFSSAKSLILAMAALLCCANAGRADLLFFTNHGAFQSMLTTLAMTDQNVLFNEAGLQSGPALTIEGITNKSGELVNVSSSKDLIGQGGQSPGVTAGNTSFPSATIAFKDPKTLIQSLFFDVDAVKGANDVVAQLTIEEESGTLTNFVDNGNNFFGVIAINNQAIVSATIQVLSSDSGLDVLEQLNQIRISSTNGNTSTGGPGPGVQELPEPQSWLIWGLSVFGLAALAGRRSLRRLVAA